MWAICIYGNSHAFFPRALQLTHFYSRTYAFHICFLSSALFAQDFSHQAFNHIGFSLLFIFSTFFIYATYASFLFSPCLVSQYVWFFGAPSLINYNFNHLLYIYSMNFETNEPFDFQLGRLLAIIIMCEKNIEEVRKKLSGNQQFHTRLIFQRLDYQKKGEITPEDIVYSLSSEHPIVNISNCQNFCRKYSISGAITYEQLLALLVPKTDKSLSQRMLIRTAKRGATLPNYLWRYFCSLLISLISMTSITEQMRRKIQNCADLNHLQMVEFFKTCLKEEAKIWRFCNINSAEEYDFTVEDVKFLSNHLRSGNSISQMTDQDIKELICSLDMNFQKTVHEMANYYQNIKIEKQKTINGAFFEQTKADQLGRKTNSTNFLNSKYKPFFLNEDRLKQNQLHNYGQFQRVPQKPGNYIQSSHPKYQNEVHDDGMILKPSRVIGGSQMYLDNFIKPIPYESERRAIELNGYMNEGMRRFRRSGYEKFEDPLSQNSGSSESNSAFVQY